MFIFIYVFIFLGKQRQHQESSSFISAICQRAAICGLDCAATPGGADAEKMEPPHRLMRTEGYRRRVGLAAVSGITS